jgi:hypothetical protein
LIARPARCDQAVTDHTPSLNQRLGGSQSMTDQEQHVHLVCQGGTSNKEYYLHLVPQDGGVFEDCYIDQLKVKAV